MKVSLKERLDEAYIDDQIRTAKEWLSLTTANILPDRRAEIWKSNPYLRWQFHFDSGDLNHLATEFFSHNGSQKQQTEVRGFPRTDRQGFVVQPRMLPLQQESNVSDSVRKEFVCA